MTGERAVETWPIFVFRLTFYVHRGSGQARVYPRRRLSLSSRAKAFTLQGRHRRFVGDSAFHTSLRGAPLLVGEQRSGITRFCKKYQVQNLIPHDCIPSCAVYSGTVCCCCLHIKSRSGLYSVLSNIRTGPTDADAFSGHRLTTQKGYTYQEEIKGPRKKVNTHAII